MGRSADANSRGDLYTVRYGLSFNLTLEIVRLTI